MRVSELEAMHAAGEELGGCDVALSISSFDHDGLGRYGDPLRPAGDLRAMSLAWRVLKPGGHLLLTVPVGPDVVVWNLHDGVLQMIWSGVHAEGGELFVLSFALLIFVLQR